MANYKVGSALIYWLNPLIYPALYIVNPQDYHQLRLNSFYPDYCHHILSVICEQASDKSFILPSIL